MPPTEPRFVVIGESPLAAAVCARLLRGEEGVDHLIRPDDDDLRRTLADTVRGVAVLLHEDVAALRYALVVARLSPEVRLIVTIFDRTVAAELSRLLPACEVISLADLALPALAGPCLDPALAAVRRAGAGLLEVREDQADPRTEEHRAAQRTSRWTRLGHLAGQLRPHDAGTRLLMLGMFSLLAVLTGDICWQIARGSGPLQALFDAARTVAGVGPALDEPRDRAYEVAASAAMLATIAATALFTAGIVERALSPRLINLVGPRTLPRSGHVIVVGMGQVGMRLCEELRHLGVPVVGVERDPRADTPRLARSAGIPVLDGHGGDRAVLERLRLPHARALAAVSSDDLDNIAVAVTAHAVAPHARVVIRAGEHEAIAETRSLLPLGTIRNVNALAAAHVLARLHGIPVDVVFTHRDHVLVRRPDGELEPPAPAGRQRCTHPLAVSSPDS